MKKKVILCVMFVLVSFGILLICQMGSYNKLLTGKIDYNRRLFDTHLIPTKIGHYQVDDKRYNVKFVHADSFASCLACPSVFVNDEIVGWCYFKSIELVNDKYFVIYYEMPKIKFGIVFDLELNLLGRVNYEGDYSGGKIIELYEQGDFIEMEDFEEYK